MVGRSNFRKSSASLEQMIFELEASGYGVYGFESRKVRLIRRLDRWFEGLLSGRVSDFCRRHPVMGKLLRKLFKASWLLMRPGEWRVLLHWHEHPNKQAARDLQQLLRQWQRQWPDRRVHLISHSAGGIVSSWVQSESNVLSLVCFGYPFKHPDMEDEPARTAHLQGVTKPFLIIQGVQDESGNAEKALQYQLSDTTRVAAVDSGHDYDHLIPEVYEYCYALICKFIERKSNFID